MVPTQELSVEPRTVFATMAAYIVQGVQRLFLVSGLLPFVLVAAVIGFGIVEPRLFGLDNLTNVARHSSYLMIVSIGQMLCLLARGMDLSVGSTVALISVVSTLVMSSVFQAYPDAAVWAIVAGITAGLGVGLIVGLVNGIGIAVVGVNPFIMTVGMLSIASGAALLLSGGMPISNLPPEFSHVFAYSTFLGIPAPIVFAALLFGIVYYVLRWMPLGRYIYAIGGNRDATHLAGINAVLYTTVTYVLCSAIVAFGGILLTARVATGEPTLGQPLMIASVTAVVIGGVSLFGGVGRIGNVVLGAFFVTLVTNGMNLTRIDGYTQQIVLGCLLILAVVADLFRSRFQRQQRGKAG